MAIHERKTAGEELFARRREVDRLQEEVEMQEAMIDAEMELAAHQG
jgi:hypothetical protein